MAPVASTTTLPTWSSVGGITLRPASTRPAAAISSSNSSGDSSSRRISDGSLVRAPSGATIVRTRSSEIAAAAVERAHGDRLARVDPAVDVAHVGPGRDVLVAHVLALEVHQGGREQPAGPQVRGDRVQHARCAPPTRGTAARAASGRGRDRTGARGRTSARLRPPCRASTFHACARRAASSRNAGSRSRPVTRWPRRASRTDTRPVPQPRSSTSRGAVAGQLVPQGRGRRRRSRTRCRARPASVIPRTAARSRGRQARHAARAGRCRWGGRRAPARRFPPARGRSRARATGSPRAAAGRRPRTSAAAPAPRRAFPSRRPGRRAGASVSKSASQIQEMSRPSAMRSLRTIHTSSSPSPSAPASVRNTSFAPAGFFTSRIASLAVAEVDLLRPAERGGEGLQAALHLVQRDPELEAAGGGRGGVVDVVEAGEPQRRPRSRPRET